MTPIVLESPPTLTSQEQQSTEANVVHCFKHFLMSSEGQDIGLNRDLHTAWLKKGLQSLPPNFSGLDASRPWFIYWITHAMEVLGDYDESMWSSKVASFLAQCQDPEGGFGGGPGQLPHLAPTYAAVCALVVAGSEGAYKVVDREKMYGFLIRMKCPHGGFRMHDEGETDMRGSYCAIAVASMLHMLTDELIEGVPEYVRRCQTWEGGIAGEQGLEAHGGYSYCGLATLCIAGKAHALDLHAFLSWVAHKQMSTEGGFAGRANKLVDSCYTFWQGAVFPLLHEAFRQTGQNVALPASHTWFSPGPLQTYVFLACQHHSGGLKDKPMKSADFYHTCYSLSGVAVSQYEVDGNTFVVGNPSNLLRQTDICYNVLVEKAERKCRFFESLPPLIVDGRQLQTSEGAGAATWRKLALEAARRAELEKTQTSSETYSGYRPGEGVQTVPVE